MFERVKIVDIYFCRMSSKLFYFLLNFTDVTAKIVVITTPFSQVFGAVTQFLRDTLCKIELPALIHLLFKIRFSEPHIFKLKTLWISVDSSNWFASEPWWVMIRRCSRKAFNTCVWEHVTPIRIYKCFV